MNRIGHLEKYCTILLQFLRVTAQCQCATIIRYRSLITSPSPNSNAPSRLRAPSARSRCRASPSDRRAVAALSLPRQRQRRGVTPRRAAASPAIDGSRRRRLGGALRCTAARCEAGHGALLMALRQVRGHGRRRSLVGQVRLLLLAGWR